LAAGGEEQKQSQWSIQNYFKQKCEKRLNNSPPVHPPTSMGSSPINSGSGKTICLTVAGKNSSKYSEVLVWDYEYVFGA